MKRQFDFFSNVQFFKYPKKMIIHGNVYIKKNAEIKELIVEGDCFIDGSLKTEKLIVFGCLHANKIMAENLVLYESAKVNILKANNIKTVGSLEITKLEAFNTSMCIGERLNVKWISGEIAELCIGELIQKRIY